MNNFKKLLASAMALTMVTSVLPATGVNAADTDSCSYTDTQKANEVASKIVYDLAQEGYTVYNVPTDEPIEWNSITVTDEETVKDVLEMQNVINHLACATSDEGKHLANMNAQIAGFRNAGLARQLRIEFATGALADGLISTTEWDADLLSLYNRVLAFDAYIGNIPSDVERATVNRYLDNAEDFKDMVDEFRSAYIGNYAKNYADALLKQEVVSGVTVEEVLDTDERFPRTNLEALTEFLEDVRNDEHTFTDTEGKTITDLPNYELVEDENEVVEIMDELDAIVEDITAVNDLMNSRSDANRALKAVDDLVEQLAVAQNENSDEDAYVLDVITKFNAEDIDNVITYVEDFFNEFYTVRKTERSNGRYTAELEPTEIERYLTASESEDLQSSDIKVILTTLVDETSRTGDTYYDELVASEGTTKDDLIAIVEEGAEVELKFSYTDTEVEAVYNARVAAATLLADGNPYDLTARERRTVTSLQSYINDVYNRIQNAEVVVTEEKDWWVYENGQWVFYQDGHTVSNRWVASNATDWYYAGANGVMLTNSWIARDSSLQVWYYVGADGKMVTNTVVDGCTIDANGEWHA